MDMTQMVAQTALGDINERLQAVLRDHELLDGEELADECVVQGLLYGAACEAKIAKLGCCEMIGDAEQDLQGDLLYGTACSCVGHCEVVGCYWAVWKIGGMGRKGSMWENLEVAMEEAVLIV